MPVDLVTRPLKQGDTWEGEALWCNPLPVGDPAAGDPDPDSPIDITGYTARLQVRRRASDPTALLTLTSAPGDGLVVQPDDGDGNPRLGVVAWRARPALTAALPTGRLVWELEVSTGDVDTDPDADRYTIVPALDLQVNAQVAR